MSKLNLKNILKNNIVYISALMFSFMVFILGAFFTDTFQSVVSSVYSKIMNDFSWVYYLLMLIFLFVCIWAALSKFKNVKLGDDDSKPEFSNISWFSMLFSAGIGIGLVFWGVAEPLSHYNEPLNIEPLTNGAREFAMTKSMLHIGVSAWACYGVLALALAYIHFRKKKPILISSLLIPLVGEEKAKGFLGKIIDIFTVFATMAGIITSLGMGTLQVNSGLNYLFNVPESKSIQVAIVLIITILFLFSACTGVKKGIKFISNANMFLAFLLFALAIIIGPFGDMLSNFLIGLKGYAIEMVTTNNNIFVKGDWYNKWTLFYWGWWIAWAPSVAIFIARISKGRTIREFIVGVLLVPGGVCMAWMTVFGTLGLNVPTEIGKLAIQKVETAMFVVFEQYPLGFLMSIVAIILLFTFFITSADSATYVLGMIVSNGKLEVKNSKKIILGILQSVLTLVLLFAGGLEMVQNASIIMALPFGIIMLISIGGFIKALSSEKLVKEEKDLNSEKLSKKEKILINKGKNTVSTIKSLDI
ncbi:BCCT family transporter [Clostridium tarantellae]|uniref:BCCT family transporter n=1 Tax=Clostridium tarantellae TaxID=39493 RepID=A0A6I1MVJ4_9CLOT|nr:BCCT family transporter [Clostridium tarantellae]MPQ44851.1 BCCT family transporter [Clostridium tarantellae]